MEIDFEILLKGTYAIRKKFEWFEFFLSIIIKLYFNYLSEKRLKISLFIGVHRNKKVSSILQVSFIFYKNLFIYFFNSIFLELFENSISSDSRRPAYNVWDPFMGTGTTGVVAAKQICNFYGSEIDPQLFAEALVRIQDAYECKNFFF